MPKVNIIVVVYNNKKWLKLTFDGIFAQTFKDFDVTAVICGNDDGSKEFLQQNYPKVIILDPAANLGFSKANNLAIRQTSGEFIQLVNPDLILESNYIEEILRVFENPAVAAATGKLLRYNFAGNEKTKIIDSTGIVMNLSGRARDRGQNQIDQGQFDDQKDVFGVSGAGPMYRRLALEKVKYCKSQLVNNLTIVKRLTSENCEYFDEDFVTYWEDVDLSWRLTNSGFKNVYAPTAVAFHGRVAGQSEGGYLHLWKFVKHHRKLSKQIKQWNYKNHILMYIKNAKHIWHPAFIFRELVMFGYILIFEISTLKVLPELFRQIPRILKKRTRVH